MPQIGAIAPARVGDDQLRAGLRRVLHPGRGDGVVHRRVGADDKNHFGVCGVAHLIGHGSRVDALHQRRDARGVAQPSAVVDVVRSEPGAYELLEEVGLFVRAFRRAEARERPLPVLVANPAQTTGRHIERFVPGRLLEHVVPVLRVDGEILVLRHTWLPQERRRETMAMLNVVEAVAAFHAQPAGVCGAVFPLHVEDPVVLDVVGELTSDAAVRAHRVDGLVGHDLGDVAGWRQRPSWTSLHAFTACDAGRIAHRVVEIEDDLRVAAAKGVADDVVHLLLAARADAARALDAGVEVNGHRGM
jgi:hypothetical protein